MDAETLARVAALELEVKAIKAHLNMLPDGQDTKAIIVDLRGAHVGAASVIRGDWVKLR